MFVFTVEIKCGKSTIILWYARATQEHMLLLFLSGSKGGSWIWGLKVSHQLTN